MPYVKLTSFFFLTLIVSCGGGGGGAPEPAPSPPAPPEPPASSEISLLVDQNMAYEKSGIAAEILMSRTGDTEAIEVLLAFDGSESPVEGSASSND